MPLSPALIPFLGQVNAANASRRARGYIHTPTNVRESLDFMTRRFVTRAPDIALIRDSYVEPGKDGGYRVPVRIYHPKPEEALPVAVFAHGGGHMAGSVSLYERIARKLALAANRVLVSVEYRLAPECPYPAGLTDLETVWRGVFRELDRLGLRHGDGLTVMGDSGGAAITAGAVHRLGDVPEIDHQVLIYPSLDYTMNQRSYEEVGEGYLLETDRVGWYFDQYFQHGEDRRAVSPLYMPLPRRVPRTLVVTAQYDPLRDEGRAYVDRLRASGFHAVHMHLEDMPHAFLNLEDLVPDACSRTYSGITEFLSGQ